MFNKNDTEPLILSIGHGNTSRVIILKLNVETNRWVKLQSMHFKQDYIKHYVVDNKLYLIGCSTEVFCAIYEWKSDQFRRQHKLNSQIMDKIRSIYFGNDIVIMERSQNKLSFYTSNDIVNINPGLTRLRPLNVVDYAIYKSLIHQELFYVEFVFNKTSLAVRFYGISIDKRGTVESRDVKLNNPVECVAQLKALLKARMPKVQSSQQHVSQYK